MPWENYLNNMNNKNVKKRDVLSYKDFIKVTKDPFAKKNLKEKESSFHKIKLQKEFQYIGYDLSVFKGTSKIDYPKTSVDTNPNSGIEVGITE